MRTRRVLGIVVLALLAAACEREVTSQEATTTVVLTASTLTPAQSTQPTTTAATAPPTAPGTTAPAPTTLPATTAAPTTIPVVSSDIVGVAVAGNSGGVGEGETDSFSEAIRNEDGTCSGWTGRDVDQPWTAGLESGAAFVALPRDGHVVIGQGTLGTSSFENVGTDAEPQWMCSFPFSGTVDGAPEEFLIKVGDLDPWLVRPDPTKPGQFVSSVNTVSSADYFPACTDQTASPVSAWNAVGTYWSVGLPNLCGAGLKIADIERPCRGPREGSDYVVKVVDAADPTVVYEDDRGMLIDPATLAPGTQVVVLIATGRPCG
ncbi:MAG TPA: hypothetical protein VFD53_05295 [Ilumatobacter sp.]|jgi:hypothetical protein|nr:hypothetical protein [Ilumatobacter sp.]